MCMVVLGGMLYVGYIDVECDGVMGDGVLGVEGLLLFGMPWCYVLLGIATL